MYEPWNEGYQVGSCCICGYEIFEGASIYYDDSGDMICEDCMENITLKEYFIDHLRGKMDVAERPDPPERDD